MRMMLSQLVGGKTSTFVTAFLVLVLGACSTQQASDAGSPGSDPLSGEEKLLATCEGRDVLGLRRHLPVEPEAVCDFLFLGMVEGFAAMGRNHPEGMFCVSSDFVLDDYREAFLATLSRKDLSKKRQEDLLLAGVVSESQAADDCSWVGQETVGVLGEDCRWLEVYDTRNSQTKAEDLAIRQGAYSVSVAKRKAAEALTRCTGFVMGYLLAGAIADRLDRDPAFCVEGFPARGEAAGPLDATMSKLAQVATSLSKAKDAQPARSSEPAGQFLFGIVAKEFPCPGSDQSV